MQRKKKYQPKDPVIDNLNNVAYKMRNNNLKIGDTFSLLLAYQHIFYVQGIVREGIAKHDNIKYLNKIKEAFERVLVKVIDNCFYNDDGVLCGNTNLEIKIHKLTRQKILYFAEMFKTIHKVANKTQNAKLIKYAKETLDLTIMAKNLPIKQFLYQ